MIVLPTKDIFVEFFFVYVIVFFLLREGSPQTGKLYFLFLVGQ